MIGFHCETVTSAIRTGGFFLCLCLAGPTARAATEQELIEGAKKEGTISYYASMDLQEANLIVSKFKEKYPFIDVKLTRADSERLLTRVLAEAKANKLGADAIQTVAFSMYTLKKHGILGKYAPAGNQFYPADFKDDGFWTTVYYNPYVVGYHTRLVAKESLTKSYEDLLNPAWKGKMLIEGTKAEWFAGMLQIMGKERGLSWMRGLARQEVINRVGHALLIQLVAAGEAAMDINIPAPSVDRLKATGAPVDWVALGPVPGVMIGAGIAAKPAHPNAAKLYIDFMLSRETQKLLQERGRWLAPRSDAPQAAKGLKIVPVKASEAENLESYARSLREIFGK
ncbi:MAG TPA: extracellular solute-binding protein [Candidatus Acidoferrales bacterium]|nr:extracellular solute-binding protein [Candidatus Acidoferrales bacterium]